MIRLIGEEEEAERTLEAFQRLGVDRARLYALVGYVEYHRHYAHLGPLGRFRRLLLGGQHDS